MWRHIARAIAACRGPNRLACARRPALPGLGGNHLLCASVHGTPSASPELISISSPLTGLFCSLAWCRRFVALAIPDANAQLPLAPALALSLPLCGTSPSWQYWRGQKRRFPWALVCLGMPPLHPTRTLFCLPPCLCQCSAQTRSATTALPFLFLPPILYQLPTLCLSDSPSRIPFLHLPCAFVCCRAVPG